MYLLNVCSSTELYQSVSCRFRPFRLFEAGAEPVCIGTSRLACVFWFWVIAGYCIVALVAGAGFEPAAFRL